MPICLDLGLSNSYFVNRTSGQKVPFSLQITSVSPRKSYHDTLCTTLLISNNQKTKKIVNKSNLGNTLQNDSMRNCWIAAFKYTIPFVWTAQQAITNIHALSLSKILYCKNITDGCVFCRINVFRYLCFAINSLFVGLSILIRMPIDVEKGFHKGTLFTCVLAITAQGIMNNIIISSLPFMIQVYYPDVVVCILVNGRLILVKSAITLDLSSPFTIWDKYPVVFSGVGTLTNMVERKRSFLSLCVCFLNLWVISS